jgi:hypothetical protein
MWESVGTKVAFMAESFDNQKFFGEQIVEGKI